MSKKFAPEFKRDVVRVARRGDLTGPRSPRTSALIDSVERWVRQADIDDAGKEVTHP